MNWIEFLEKEKRGEASADDFLQQVNVANAHAILEPDQYASFVDYIQRCDKYNFEYITRHTTPQKWFAQNTQSIDTLINVMNIICTRQDKHFSANALWSIGAIKDDYGLPENNQPSRKTLCRLRLMDAMREYGYFLKHSNPKNPQEQQILVAETDYALRALGYSLEIMRTQHHVVQHFTTSGVMGELYTILRQQLEGQALELEIDHDKP